MKISFFTTFNPYHNKKSYDIHFLPALSFFKDIYRGKSLNFYWLIFGCEISWK